MGRYRFNPFTGTLDDVGTGGGGAGTVTSVAGGEGITATPEPIVGAGALDLDIFSLTTGVGMLQSGDWLPIVDVSVGTTPASQRKVPLSDLVAFLNDGFIDHDRLDELTTGDAGHTQFLLLAGRPGITNDPLLSTSGVIGTVYGTAVANGSLGLRGAFNPATAAEGETVIALSKMRVSPNFGGAQIGGTEFSFFDAGGTGNYELSDLATIQALICQAGFNMDAGTVTGIRAMRVVNFRSVISNDAGSVHDMGPFRGFNLVHRYTPGAGATMVNLDHFALNNAPIFDNTGGPNTITRNIGVNMAGGAGAPLGASWTAADWSVGRLAVPAGAGAGTITRFGGLNLETTVGTTLTIGAAYSVWAKGPGYFLAHEGAAVFGAAQATLTAPTAGAIVDAFGNVLLNNTGTASELRLREPSAGGASYTGFVAPALAASLIYTLPAAFPATNGESLTGTTAGVMSWAAMQPLDADLTTLAGLTVAQGALLVGSAAPAWSVLGIGATDKYLRSNGTTAAWASVTELGLVDTYNSIATVSNGLPVIYAEANLTLQGGNIGGTTIYTPPTTGIYRVVVEIIITRVATTSSVMPSVVLAFTSGDSSTLQVPALTATAAGNALTTRAQASHVFFPAASAVQYSTTGYVSVGATSMQYALRIRLERL